ncbi:tRNA 2-selenouridine(34) synthase MnmH [Granulosicoccaceae sp. 1_MG-2023]|nr:tRNA 2-selenouridine(34) synthase MnmH [Granulosicoccaceae sp. 1_MG-2023]
MHRPDTDDYLSLLLSDTPLIDTRAPVEFAQGAFPGAVNLPLMSDDERAQVGTCYKQHGQAAAIELGRRLVTPALQQARVEAWADFARRHPHGYLYCFRGGLRSQISQQWLHEAGIDYPRIRGGYKAMRRFLLDSLEPLLQRLPLLIIAGSTGCGKTDLIRALPRAVDLEGLAGHRGSSFGAVSAAQPPQIAFENALIIQLLKRDAAGPAPVPLEDEGRLIGRRDLPQPLLNRMKQAPVVLLEAPLERRIELALRDYVSDLYARLRQQGMDHEQAVTTLAGRHRQSLFRIRKRLGGERYQYAGKLLDIAVQQHLKHDLLSAYEPLIALLLTDYYDPMYHYQLRHHARTVLAKGDHDTLLAFISDHLQHEKGGN